MLNRSHVTEPRLEAAVTQRKQAVAHLGAGHGLDWTAAA
jgi:hypothetical protein